MMHVYVLVVLIYFVRVFNRYAVSFFIFEYISYHDHTVCILYRIMSDIMILK